jgi:hypothetical protein
VPCVTPGKHHALAGNRIDVRRWYRATGDAATECRQVVDAEIIRQNKDNIRRAIARRAIGRRRALLPLYLNIRADLRLRKTNTRIFFMPTYRG